MILFFKFLAVSALFFWSVECWGADIKASQLNKLKL